MPSLDRSEQLRLIGPTMGCCSSCGCQIIRQYCRECDEFWFECGCHLRDGSWDIFQEEAPRPSQHDGHRAYRYINRQVVADPFEKTKRTRTPVPKKEVKHEGLGFALRPRPSE